MLKLPDVTRPVISLKNGLRIRRDTSDIPLMFLGIFRQKVNGQRQDIFGAIAKRRYRNAEDLEPVNALAFRTNACAFGHLQISGSPGIAGDGGKCKCVSVKRTCV